MIEWNEIIQLFRFLGILGQPRGEHQTFWNETPTEISVLFAPQPGISGIFGQIEKGPDENMNRHNLVSKEVVLFLSVIVFLGFRKPRRRCINVKQTHGFAMTWQNENNLANCKNTS